MPDLLTHTLVNYATARPFLKPERVFLFVAGATVPDALSRTAYILVPAAYNGAQALHSPAGVLLACWTASRLFVRAERGTVIGWLLAGGALHFCLDVLQSQTGAGYWWLFPFSTASFSLDVVPPDASLTALPAVVLIAAVVEAVTRWRRARRRAEA